MKRIISALLLAVLVLTALCSCGGDKDIEYREEGLSFTLPKSMRRSNDSVYEFFLSSPDSLFCAKKLDGDFMESAELSKDTTAGEYADAYIKVNMLDKERIAFTYDESRGAYSFKYNNSDNGEELFHYITVIGNPGAIWFIEMCCENENASTYEDTFEIWQRSISVY